jgi:hypothetical protein
LEVLEQYDQRHPRAKFAPEAVALRVETLQTLGETQSAQALSAQALGEQFLTQYPTKAIAHRIAKIIRR